MAVATAQLRGEPSMMLTDGFVGMLATREELAAALAGAQPQYAAQGLARATHTDDGLHAYAATLRDTPRRR